MMENQISLPQARSSFVSVFAWLMIIFNGFGVFMAIVENVIFALVFKDRFSSGFDGMGGMAEGFPSFFLRNIRIILPLFSILILLGLIASIGLLKRKEWARKAFLFLLGFGILYTIVATVIQIFFMKSVFHNSEMPSEISSMQIVFIISLVVFSLGFIFLFGWLMKKLSSANIKEEFIS